MVKLILSIILSTLLSVNQIVHAENTKGFDAPVDISHCQTVSSHVDYLKLLLGSMGGGAVGFVFGGISFGPIGAISGAVLGISIGGYKTLDENKQYECRIQITHEKKNYLFTITSHQQIKTGSMYHFNISPSGQIQPF